MDVNLRTELEKLAWLELYMDVNGPTKKLMEKIIRRGVKKAVAPQSITQIDVQPVQPNPNPPEDKDFKNKVASFQAKYERR